LIPTTDLGMAVLRPAIFSWGVVDEAERVLQRATERHVENPILVLVGYNIAVLKNDKGALDRISTLARGKPTIGHSVAHAEALALARSGRLQLARQSSSRAIDLAVQERQREAAASYQARASRVGSRVRNAAEAKKNATAALALSHGRDVEYAAGLALALSGDSSRSDPLADDLDERFPEDTFAKFTYVPVLRALSALEHGKPADSVERLQIALPYEVAVSGLNFNHFYLGGLHSAYVRGEALVAAHRYAEAPLSFRRFSIIVGSWVRIHWRTGARAIGQSVRVVGRQGQGQGGLPGFPHVLEGRRFRCSDLLQAKTEYARLP